MQVFTTADATSVVTGLVSGLQDNIPFMITLAVGTGVIAFAVRWFRKHLRIKG